MASLRTTAQCIGLSGQVSILKDFYGYWTKAPTTLSLGAQVRLLQGKHIHLNLIQTANFDVSQREQIDKGLHFMRQIYATVNMGVGRIQRFSTPPGYEVIDGDSEAEDLWNEFSVPNANIDVFLVRTISGVSRGKSPSPGSCDKDSKNDSGCVIPVEDNDVTLGYAIAHEVGHYLGLRHHDDPNNLMFFQLLGGMKILAGQGVIMMLHCSVSGGCRT